MGTTVPLFRHLFTLGDVKHQKIQSQNQPQMVSVNGPLESVPNERLRLQCRKSQILNGFFFHFCDSDFDDAVGVAQWYAAHLGQIFKKRNKKYKNKKEL